MRGLRTNRSDGRVADAFRNRVRAKFDIVLKHGANDQAMTDDNERSCQTFPQLGCIGKRLGYSRVKACHGLAIWRSFNHFHRIEAECVVGTSA